MHQENPLFAVLFPSSDVERDKFEDVLCKIESGLPRNIGVRLFSTVKTATALVLGSLDGETSDQDKGLLSSMR